MEQKFLEAFAEAMEIEDRSLSMIDNFREYEEWDSLANLSVIAMIDEEFEVVIDAEQFANMTTLQEVFDKIVSETANKK